MPHDVFISYAAEDKLVGNAVCARLETRAVRCWIAPRDVLPGTSYGEAILDGIQESRILVLIYSASANNSPHIHREIERAVSKGLVIIPFRIESVPLSKSLEYFISAPHWLDAMTEPLEQHIEQLADTIQLLLARPTPQPDASLPSAAMPLPPSPPALAAQPLPDSIIEGPAAAELPAADLPDGDLPAGAIAGAAMPAESVATMEAATVISGLPAIAYEMPAMRPEPTEEPPDPVSASEALLPHPDGAPLPGAETEPHGLPVASSSAVPAATRAPRRATGAFTKVLIAGALLTLLLVVGGGAFLLVRARAARIANLNATTPVVVALATQPAGATTPGAVAPTAAAAAPTRAASSSAVASPTATGTVLLANSLADAASGVLPSTTRNAAFKVAYMDGQYSIQRLGVTGAPLFAPVLSNVADSITSIDVSVVTSDNDSTYLALTCRSQDPGTLQQKGYVLFFQPALGHYILNQWNTVVKGLANSNDSSILRGTATNHVQLSCVGSHIAVAVNGKTLADVTDTTYTSGQIDVGASYRTGDPANFDMRLSNLEVSSPT